MKTPHVPRFTLQGQLRGRVYSVTDPDAAARLLLDLLAQQGFAVRDASLANAALAADGSSWRVAYTVAGSAAKTWWWDLVGEVIPVFARPISETAMVLAVRGTELVVAPLESRRGDPSAPRATRIVDAVLDDFERRTLGHAHRIGEPFLVPPDPTAPVTSKAFRRISGWR